MKKNLIIFCLVWFIAASLLVVNARAGNKSCQSIFTSCVESCQQKYPIPDPDLRVDPGDMNKTTKAQQFEARKQRKECVRTCKIDRRNCKAN